MKRSKIGILAFLSATVLAATACDSGSKNGFAPGAPAPTPTPAPNPFTVTTTYGSAKTASGGWQVSYDSAEVTNHKVLSNGWTAELINE